MSQTDDHAVSGEIASETPGDTDADDSIDPRFADIPGYDDPAHAKVSYENSMADSVDSFRRSELVRQLLDDSVPFRHAMDSGQYPNRGLISINDSGSMAIVRVDEVAKAVIIETGDRWIALDPDDTQNVIQALQMADDYLEDSN